MFRAELVEASGLELPDDRSAGIRIEATRNACPDRVAQVAAEGLVLIRDPANRPSERLGDALPRPLMRVSRTPRAAAEVQTIGRYMASHGGGAERASGGGAEPAR